MHVLAVDQARGWRILNTTEASADLVPAPFTKFALCHCPITPSSKSDINVSFSTPARAGFGDDGSVSGGCSDFSACGLRSSSAEAEVTVAALKRPRHVKTELVFGKDSQDWFTALVLVFICIGSESQHWDSTISQIRDVPIQLQPHAASITVGNNSDSLQELFEAFLTATHFPLGYHVECRLRKDKAVLGDACALVSTFLRKMVESILESHPGVTEPQEVSPHSWKYVFTMLEFCNQIAYLHSGSFRMLPQYWASSHGDTILRSIKMELQCGDQRKDTNKRKLLTTVASGMPEGRCNRGSAGAQLQYSPRLLAASRLAMVSRACPGSVRQVSS